MQHPNPWFLWEGTLSNFLLSLLDLGTPLETSLVGVFDKEEVGRGSRRDMDLPLHRDGVFSQALADAQGGFYVEKAGIDIVGLYCLRGSTKGRCETLLEGTEPCTYCQGKGFHQTGLVRCDEEGIHDSREKIRCVACDGGGCKRERVELKEGQGLVFDNTKLLHGRRGPVGERILMRVWLKKNQ